MSNTLSTRRRNNRLRNRAPGAFAGTMSWKDRPQPRGNCCHKPQLDSTHPLLKSQAGVLKNPINQNNWDNAHNVMTNAMPAVTYMPSKTVKVR